ncbi:HTTM domain-containing protein [Streptomyces pseudogriseolus]|uniref:HTTM domain-containing protein n=1 Tax=Streptomyces pseudogriseolus TaxID=36817 RepID=UPI003FA23106
MNRLWPAVSGAVARVTDSALGPYQTAVLRIGVALTWLLFLLREYPHRQELYGPDSPWSWDLAAQLVGANDAFTVLLWSDSQVWFEAVYALAVLFSLLLLLGWRARTMSALFMVGVLSLQNRSVFMGDGGDNVLHLMAIYLVLTRCGQVWSLDARRARRAARARARGKRTRDGVGPALWAVLGVVLLLGSPAGRTDGDWFIPALLWAVWLGQAMWWLAGRLARTDQPRILLDVAGNVVHNGALLVIMAEACLIYATAGWYKVQGSRWQDGTAVHYPLHLEYFSPWPSLAGLLTASGTLVMLVTYVTVVVQVAFPFTLFNRRVKNLLLGFMILEHAVIAVVLGLPFFSLAMIAADAVFLPTSFLRRAGRLAARARGRLRPRGDAVPVPPPRRPDGPPGRPSVVGPAQAAPVTDGVPGPRT